MKMPAKIPFKLLLYVVLILLVVTMIIYWRLSDQSSLSENFLAGSIEILITVIVIDGLISADRRRRMRSINEQNAATVKVMLGLKIIRIIHAFGAKVSVAEIDLVNESNANVRAAVDEFKASKEYATFLTKMANMEKSLQPKIKKLSKIIEDETSDLNKLLKDAKPYPDPSLTAMIAEFQPKMIAKFAIINLMYDAIYTHLPAKGHTNVKKDKDFWPFFQQMYKDLAVNDEGSDKKELISFEHMVDGMLELILQIRQRAENNDLHYDV